jgi:hypothetical protein
MSTLCPITHPILCPKDSLQDRKKTPCVRAPNECDIDVVEGKTGASVKYQETKSITRENVNTINSLKEFDETYTIENVLDSDTKTGQSASIMAFGRDTANSKPVAIKISPMIPTNMKFDGLAYESEMYMSMFYDFRNTMPNFISWVDSFTISIDEFNAHRLNPRGHYKSRLYSEINSLITNTRANNGGNNNVTGILFLVTERADGFIPLTKYIKNLKKLPAEESTKRLCDLVFQIVFCLHVLVMRGFQHNDLHTSNILINGTDEIDVAEYTAMGKTFYLQNFHQLVIFDWDFGVSRTIGTNYLLENGYCPRIGVCNYQNDRFDIYTILRTINLVARDSSYNLPKDFQVFYNNIIQQLEKENFFARMCNQQTNRSKAHIIVDIDLPDAVDASCKPYADGHPVTVLVPEMAILHEYFSNLLWFFIPD